MRLESIVLATDDISQGAYAVLAFTLNNCIHHRRFCFLECLAGRGRHSIELRAGVGGDEAILWVLEPLANIQRLSVNFDVVEL